MKRTAAIFLCILLVFTAVPSFADEICRVRVPYSVMDETGIYYSVPLSAVARTLGYDVTFESGVVTASKGNIRYVFDVPGYLFYYIEDGVRYDASLSYPPVIYDGVTYVEEYFFTDYMCPREGVEFDYDYYWDEESGEDGIEILLYSLQEEKQAVNDAYDKLLAAYGECGIDLMSETEAKTEMKFNTNISCESLGIDIKGDGSLLMDIYSNMKEGVYSLNMSGDVSGIFNIIKLSSGKPLDEVGPVDVSVYSDKSGTYQKDSLNNNLYSDIYGEEAEGKWIYTPAATEGEVNMADAVMTACDNMIYNAPEKASFLESVAKAIEYSGEKIKFSKQGGKVLVTSVFENEDIKEIAKMFGADMALFENSNISLSETEVFEGGKLKRTDARIDIEMVCYIPEVNVPVNVSVSITVSGVGGSSSAMKSAPADSEVFFYEGIY